MDLFNSISSPNPAKVKTRTRPRAAHEVSLLTATATRVIDMEEVTEASESSGIPSPIEKSSLDFADEDPLLMISEGVGTKVRHEMKYRMRSPRQGILQPRRLLQTWSQRWPQWDPWSARGVARGYPRGKSLTSMGLAAGSLFVTPTNAKSVSDLDPLSYAEPRPFPEKEIAQSSEIPTGNVATVEMQNLQSAGSLESGKSTSISSMVGSPEGRYNINLAQQVAMGSQLRLRFEQEVRLLKKARAQIARRDQRIQVRDDEIKRLDQEIQSLRTVEEEVHGPCNRTKNLETLMEAELSQQVSNLQAQVAGEEKIKAAFEDFKKYEDDKVEHRCAEMYARLDALSIDFDEELYPHMLTAIAGLRNVFANVVSAGIAKGMSEELKHGVEHGKAKLDLTVFEAYDPEADAKYVAALHALKDLRYPLVDQLEKLKDALIDLIMESLHLESDAGEDTPQWVRDLRPNSSQLKIPVYPEVSDHRNLWAFKEEILLEDAITANISRAEKKKKCQVACRTHGVGSAHHARSDGVPVSVPTVAPQGLAILLADAATQTETSEDEASPRLIRSKSLPPMYNLDWP
ncbi:hypothetical protein Tco_1467613 [Tanacetum coccineum]